MIKKFVALPVNSIVESEELKNVIPRPSDEEYNYLKKSIQEQGFHSSLIVTPMEDGRFMLVDGYTRLQVLKELGVTSPVPCEVREYKSKDEMMEDVYSLNLIRRHLTASQKAVILLKWKELEAKRAAERKKSKEFIGKKDGQPVRRDETPIPESEKGRAIEIVAKKGGVSVGTLHKAQKLSEATKELKEAGNLLKAVENGQISLNQALKQLDKIKREKTSVRREGNIIQVPVEQLATLDLPPQDVLILQNYHDIIDNYESFITVLKKDAHIYAFVNDDIELSDLLRTYSTDLHVLRVFPIIARSNVSPKFAVLLSRSLNRAMLSNQRSFVHVPGFKVFDTIIRNSTVENENILQVGDFPFCAVCEKIHRNYTIVIPSPTRFEKFAAQFEKYKKDAEDYYKGENTNLKDARRLVIRFWKEVKGLTDEQLNKQPKQFYIKETQAANELLVKGNDIDEIIETAKQVVANDAFWKKQLTISNLVRNWAVLSTKYDTGSIKGEERHYNIEEM